MDTMEWPPEPGTAIVVAALEGVFRKLNVLLGPITTSSPVTQSTQSITQSSKQGLTTAGTLYFTALKNLASSAPTSSNTQRSKGLSLSEDKGEAPPEPIRDPIRKPAKGE